MDVDELKESEGNFRSFEKFQGVSRSFKEFQSVSKSLKEFKRVSKSFKEFQRVSRFCIISIIETLICLQSSHWLNHRTS